MTKELTFEHLREANVGRCNSTTGFNHVLNTWSVGEWGCAVAGEVGEACNIAKKLLRVRDGIPGNRDKTTLELRDELARELADVIIYLDLWAASEHIDLAATIRETFNDKSEEIGYDGDVL